MLFSHLFLSVNTDDIFGPAASAASVFVAGRLQPSPATLAGGLAFGSAGAGRRGTAWEALAAWEAREAGG